MGIDALEEQVKQVVAKSRKILDKAAAENRDLTKAEEIAADETIAEGRSLLARVKRAKADQAALDAIRAIDEGPGYGVGSSVPVRRAAPIHTADTAIFTGEV